MLIENMLFIESLNSWFNSIHQTIENWYPMNMMNNNESTVLNIEKKTIYGQINIYSINSD